jgi:hypothetical protein
MVAEIVTKGYLSPDVVHQAIHTRFHAEGVLAWQQLRVSIAIQADGARQQLFELLHTALSLMVSVKKLVSCYGSKTKVTIIWTCKS